MTLRTRVFLATGVLLATGLLLAACTETPPAMPQSPAGPELEVDLQGFRARLPAAEGGVTVPLFDLESPPVLVVRGVWPQTATVRLETALAPLPVSVEPRGPVTIVRLTLPPEATARDAVLRLDILDTGAKPLWTSTLAVSSSTPDAHPALGEIRARARSLSAPEAIRALSEAAAGLPAGLRLWLVVDIARRRASLGAAEGVAGWRAAADEARAQRVDTEVSRRLRAAAAQAVKHRDFAGAERLLDEAEIAEGPQAEHRNPAAVVRLKTARAYREKALGNFRRATSLLESATALAWENGLDADWAASSQALATLWQDLGRHSDALELIEHVSAWYSTHPKVLDGGATVANNHGWILSRAMADGVVPFDAARPRALFEAARRQGETTGDVVLENVAFSSLAELAVNEGNVAEARRLHTAWASRAQAGAGFSRLDTGLLGARIDLLESKPGPALAAFLQWEQAALAESSGLLSDNVLRARHGQALSLTMLGRRREARQRYDSVLSDLGRLALQTDLQQDRSPFLARRHALFEEATALALADADLDSAFDLVDAGQAPALQSLAVRSRAEAGSPAEQAAHAARLGRWLTNRDDLEAVRRALRVASLSERPALDARVQALRESLAVEFDALNAQGSTPPTARARALPHTVVDQLGPNVALLALTRLGAQDHALFVRNGAPARHLGPGSLPELVAALRALPCKASGGRQQSKGLSASAPCNALDSVTVLYVVPGDVFGARDLADLFVGPTAAARPTIAFIPFAAWLLDTGTRPGSAPSAAAGPVAPPLLVSDPEGNLPFARLEGADAARRLTRPQQPVPRVLVGAAADRTAVLEALAAGPRLFHYSGHGVLDAASPWDAHLRLAAGTRLTVADVLLLDAPLGTVILSGCQTGGGMALSAREHVSLAEAFLLAGARTVLATRHRVDDAAARAVLDQFHAQGGAENPAAVLRHLETRPELDEAALRVLRSFAIFGRAQ